MHEVSLMQRTLELALEQASGCEATRIHRISMRIGSLSGVVRDSLVFAFDVVTRGTIAQDALFEVEDVPAQCVCPSCDTAFHPVDYNFACPSCGNKQTRLERGTEIELTSLEVS